MENQESPTAGIENVEISLLDGNETQTRHAIRPDTVDEYAEVLNSGGELPPGTAYRDRDDTMRLADGFHRREAHKKTGRTTMRCRIFSGDKWAAVQAGIRDNRQHRGERLSRDDKAHAVRMVLKIQPGDSDMLIGSLCGVSPRTVAKYRAELESTSQIAGLETRVGQDGRIRRLPQRERATDGLTEQFPVSCLSPHPANPQTLQGDLPQEAKNEPGERFTEEVTDSVAQAGAPSPERRKFPYGKPIRDLFKEMKKHLGKANSLLYELRDQNPKNFVKCRALLSEIVLALEAWERECAA